MPSAALVTESQSPTTVPPRLIKQLPKLTPRRLAESKQGQTVPCPPTPALSGRPHHVGHRYFQPRRCILSQGDHEQFLHSETHNLIISFIFTLSDSVRGKTISGVRESLIQDPIPAITALLTILDEADHLVSLCPPTNTASRFGNPAFRDYLGRLEGLARWHGKLGVTDQHAVDEISVYLSNSFGNAARIDYGSGHELNFVLWLLCLRQLSIVPDSAFPALALLVFPRYLRLMRTIQSTYYLEPAGSHGVWGLDDYQFLPFLFGASQLIDHKHIRPMSIHNQMIIEECSKDYLYLDQVQWVNASKTVQGLRWHSPMLDDISSAKSWAKVEAGMRRMFLAEVLGKLPVAQHLVFGSLLPATAEMSRNADRKAEGEIAGEVMLDGMKHVHIANSWGDCCGIKVPSAVGARLEARKMGTGGELRRLPFD